MTVTNTTPLWLDRKHYPFQSRYIQLEAGQMHYVDEGEGPPLLFIHGTPTWSFLYREIIMALRTQYRCIAVDHLGFGLSENPSNYRGRPEDHAINLIEFIEALELNKITLVVHDFGGPIGLGAGIQLAHRIDRVVLMNSWLWATKDNEQALKIDRLINGWLGRMLYLQFNFSPKVLLKKGFADQSKLTKSVHRHYTQPFPTKTARVPLLNIAKSLVGSSDWYQQQWDKLDRLADKQWFILWGMKDVFLNENYLDKWIARLPKADVRQLDCGHFVQEEQSDELIRSIRIFMDK